MKSKQLYGIQNDSNLCTINGDDVNKCYLLRRSIYEYFLQKILTAIVLNL